MGVGGWGGGGVGWGHGGECRAARSQDELQVPWDEERKMRRLLKAVDKKMARGLDKNSEDLTRTPQLVANHRCLAR